MFRRLIPALAWFAVLGFSASPRDARAEPAVEPVHVVYDADAGCPDRAKFVEQILARTRKASMVGPNEARRIFAVTLRAHDETSFVGRLEIRSTSEASTDREVTGPTCAAVTTALALIAALAIDPESVRSDPSPVDAPAGAAPAPSQAQPIAPPPSLPAASVSPSVWRWRVGAAGEGLWSAAPSVALGGSVFAELATNEAGDGSVDASFGLSSLRLGLHYAKTGTVRGGGGAAKFDWAAVGLEGCLLRVRLGPRADVRACTAISAGALGAEGVDIPRSETPTRPWWSIASLLRFQWFVGPPWFVDADAALVIPLRRDSFVFEDPTRTFHDVPVVGAGASLGLGYGFGDRGRGARP